MRFFQTSLAIALSSHLVNAGPLANSPAGASAAVQITNDDPQVSETHPPALQPTKVATGKASARSCPLSAGKPVAYKRNEDEAETRMQAALEKLGTFPLELQDLDAAYELWKTQRDRLAELQAQIKDSQAIPGEGKTLPALKPHTRH